MRRGLTVLLLVAVAAMAVAGEAVSRGAASGNGGSGPSCRVLFEREGRTAAQQGMELSGRWLFCLEDGGNVNVYDFRRLKAVPVASFTLASSQRDNHANNAEFGVEKAPGASFPLMYVTNGKVGSDIEWVCYVESITRRGKSFRSELAQKIVLDISGWAAKGLDPIFGAPSWMIDRERKALWVFSAHKRTTPQVTKDPSENRYIATRFRIPTLSEGTEVRLTADDVLQQVVFPFDAWFTQAGCVRDGKIWYCFGVGKPGRPSLVRVYDTDTGAVSGWDLQDQIPCEMEDMVLRGRRLYVNINEPGKPRVFVVTLP